LVRDNKNVVAFIVVLFPLFSFAQKKTSDEILRTHLFDKDWLFQKAIL